MRELGPEVFLYGSHLDVRWVSPVRTDTQVEASAAVASIDQSALVLELSTTCDGQTCMVGSATIPLMSG